MKERTLLRKSVCLALAFLLVSGSCLQAIALSGNVTGRKQATVTSGSINWSFTLKDTDDKKYDATCMEPSNDTIPAVGTKVTMNVLLRSSNLAKVAYLGSRRHTGDTDKQMYVISRAAARLSGDIGANQYVYTDDVNDLYNDAKAREADVPKDFIAYKAYDSGGGQTMLAWRTLDNGTLRVKKVAEDGSTTYSLAGAKYGVYETRAKAKAGKEEDRIKILTTKESGYSNEPSLPPKTYYVKEYLAPDPFLLDEGIHAVTVKEDQLTTFTSEEPVARGGARVHKVPASCEFLLEDFPETYSLAGAEYNLYSKESLSAASLEGTMTTKATGYSSVLPVEPGTYWAKETKASPGFQLDPQVHKVVVEDGKTTTFTSVEEPITDPLTVFLYKTDGTGGGPSLAGAQFQVDYYKEVTNSVSGLTPVRSWVFETKLENGRGVIGFLEKYKISGPPLFTNDAGAPIGVIGTYVFTEIKAPKGYQIDPTPRIAHVTTDGRTNPSPVYNAPTVPNNPKQFRLQLYKRDSVTGAAARGDASLVGGVFGLYRDGTLLKEYTTDSTGAFLSQYFTIGDGSHVYTVKEITPPEGYLPNDTVYTLEGLDNVEALTTEYTTINRTINNDVVEGSIAITKVYGAESGSGTLKPEPGIQFEVYLKSAGSYAAAEDHEKDLLTTDADGLAQSKNLPWGTYTVHQVNTIDGHIKVDDFDVIINENGKVYSFVLNNRETKADIILQKKDAETGKIIPAADTAFKIRKAGTEEYVSFELNYPNRHTIDTFVTDESGTCRLPDKLQYGAYELVEQKVPAGYVLSDAPVAFAVDGSEAVVTVVMENMPQKGIIKISKTGDILKTIKENPDGSFTPVFVQGPLAGVAFDIIAKEDIVTPEGTKRYDKGEKVDTVTTDAGGKAKSKELYLGEYEVVEKEPPAGYVKQEKNFDVTLRYAGQSVSVTEETLAVENLRQQLQISFDKTLETDKDFGYDGSSYKEIVFGLYAAEEITASDGTFIPADGLIDKAGVMPAEHTAGLYQGKFTTSLPHKSYYVKELKTAEGYILDDARYPVSFTYDNPDAGLIIKSLNDGKPLANVLIRGNITGLKTDTDGNALAGALIGLFREGETVFTKETALATDVSDQDGAFRFISMPCGRYVVREIKAPAGYVLSEEAYSVEISTAGEVVEIKVINRKQISQQYRTRELQQPKPLAPLSPKTGDVGNPLLWMLVACMAIPILIACTRRKK